MKVLIFYNERLALENERLTIELLVASYSM